MATIRPYEPRDLAAVDDICVRTADRGADARGLYSDDDLMPDVYAGPYVTLEPELAFVLDDGSRPVGYVLGTADTARFAQRYADEWIPSLAGKYARPAHAPATREEEVLDVHFNPQRSVIPALASFPAHLHIDLLPVWQGRGFGRALIERLLAARAAAGAPAVHLGMTPSNVAARASYDRLGFVELDVPGAVGVTYLGRSTA